MATEAWELPEKSTRRLVWRPALDFLKGIFRKNRRSGRPSPRDLVLGRKMTILLLQTMGLLYFAGFIMLFSRHHRFGVDEIIPLLGAFYCFTALTILRYHQLHELALKGLALFIFIRCVLVWGMGSPDQVMITTMVLILFLPVLLASGIMQGWSRRRSFGLVWLIGGTVLLFSILRSGEVYAFGAPPALFPIAFVLSFSMLVGFLSQWRSSHIELALKRKEVLKLSNLATHDALTGMLNRRAGGDMLFVQLIAGAELSVAFIDLDHFKLVNDQKGHAEGDRVLRNVASKIEAELRDADELIRWGGDEFLVIMPETLEYDAQQVAERVRKAIEDFCEPPFDKITTSIGITTAVPGDNVRSILNRADEAVYQAKEGGRNCVVTVKKSDH